MKLRFIFLQCFQITYLIICVFLLTLHQKNKNGYEQSDLKNNETIHIANDVGTAVNEYAGQ